MNHRTASSPEHSAGSPDPSPGAADLRTVLDELRALRSEVARLLKALDASMPFSPRPSLDPASALLTPTDHSSASPAVVGASSQPVLSVQCFGPFQSWLDGRPLELGRSRKGHSVFRFLVAHGGGPVPREALMEWLWPGVPQPQARHRLNMAVYSLRQGLQRLAPFADGVILCSDGAYILNPALRLDVDADRFMAAFRRAEAALEAGDERAALVDYELADRIYVGDYLPEERYSDWAHLPQQRLEDAHNTGLVKLGRLYLSRGDYGRAIRAVQDVLAHDPCQEEAHRILMRCHARQGRRPQALRQFVLCAQTLKEELGVEPSEQTLRLAQEIREVKRIKDEG